MHFRLYKITMLKQRPCQVLQLKGKFEQFGKQNTLEQNENHLGGFHFVKLHYLNIIL